MFVSSLFRSQTITECESSIKTFLDSDGKPYVCVSDHSGEILFLKKISKDTSTYECVIFHKDSVMCQNKKGVVVFLSNNTRMEKLDAEIYLEAVDVLKKAYVYTATIKLTKEDINTLLTHSITSVGLYNMYRQIENGDDYKSDLFCLIIN